ncbi:alpha/beta fold hydrolase [Nocardia xishanensis]
MAAADGIVLSASRLGSVSAPASVVYLPGLLTDSTYWTPLTTHLHARLDGGIAQILYSLPRRHHDRLAPRSTLPVLVEDLDTILTLARGAVILVVHSAGSLLAGAWAQQHPRRAGTLAGLVLLNPWPDLLDLAALLDLPASDRFQGREHLLLGELTRHLYDPPSHRGMPRRSRLDTSTAGVDALAAALASYKRTPFDDEVVSVVRGLPTWVLAGGSDPIISPRRAQMLAEHLWADYDAIPGAGHSLPHVDPARAAEPIFAALEVAYRDHQHGRSPW